MPLQMNMGCWSELCVFETEYMSSNVHDFLQLIFVGDSSLRSRFTSLMTLFISGPLSAALSA